MSVGCTRYFDQSLNLGDIQRGGRRDLYCYAMLHYVSDGARCISHSMCTFQREHCRRCRHHHPQHHHQFLAKQSLPSL